MLAYEINRIAKLSNVIRLYAIILSVVYGILLFFSIFLLVFPKIYLSLSLRATLVGMSFLPILLLLLTLWIYETIPAKRNFSNSTLFSSLIILSYLFLPAVIIIFRYDDIFSFIAKIVGLIQFLLVVVQPLFKVKGINLLPLINSIFIDFSSSSYKPINLKLFNNQIIDEKLRKSKYFNKQNLEVFQTSFNSCSIEYEKISECLTNTSFLKDKKSLEILDIGGFDGEFLQKLVSKQNISVSFIHCIDPNVEVEKYLDYFKNICTNIKFTKSTFENYYQNEIEKYDLIIANHSLYSYFDKSDENINIAIKDIQKFLRNNSLIVMSLGSKNSPAYEFKNSIHKLILNENCTDYNIEKLIKSLKKYSELKLRFIYTDNYINATKILNDDELFKNWIEYFARINLDVDSYTRNQIKETLKFYSFYGSQLAECQKHFNQIEENEYLLHKTGTVLLSTIAENVYDVHGG